MLDILINRLVSYGINTGLISPEDRDYTINSILDIFEIDSPVEGFPAKFTDDNEETLEEILEGLLDIAYEKGLIAENTVTYSDLFDTKLMGVFVKRPSEVIRDFADNYRQSPEKATDMLYKLSGDSNYIRRYRIKKDLRWKVSTEYGEIDITINLSKPEKDPRDIAAAKKQKQTGYPKCVLCKENEGYMGRINHPARQNLRVVPVTLDGKQWYLQYSPYVYYNEHCIVFSDEHTPIVIDEGALRKLFDFSKQFPHYLIGSNADLPIVGGSILSHEHFQGGRYEFALNRAQVETEFSVEGFENVACGIVKWPMSVIRLESENEDELLSLSCHILNKWKNYTDEDAFIFARTGDEQHNTITPILYRREKSFVMDIVLRNNITTEEHPLGVFHPHSSLHHIKKENIGLIEVMGLAVLPSRLREELILMKEAILSGKDISQIPEISSHACWVNEFMKKYHRVHEENIDEIFRNELGLVFLEVLKDAGVYKRTSEGKENFLKFIGTL